MPAITRETALGLIDPADRTPLTPPKKCKVAAVTPAVVKCLVALDDLIHEHREVSLTLTRWDGTLFEGPCWGAIAECWFSGPDWQKTPDENRKQLPLAEIWEKWWLNRPSGQRDPDSLVNTRALVSAGNQ